VAEFKGYYDTLRNYSTQQIGRALSKMGIDTQRVKIEGDAQRFRLLPVPWEKNSNYEDAENEDEYEDATPFR